MARSSTVVVNKLDVCHCDSMKLVKETLSQISGSEFREDIAGTKKLIEETWKTIRYERQLESVKQIDNEMTNLIKSSFNEKLQ